MNLSYISPMHFELPPLPYDFEALEPIISADMLRFHYSKHHQTYVNNLNKALEQFSESMQKGNFSTLGSILQNLQFNWGGHFNHTFFWNCLTPKSQGGGELPKGALAEAIMKDFGSIQQMIDLLSAKTLAVQGSGWGWLGYDSTTKRLNVTTCSNQETLDSKGLTPLLCIDAWEHAYYLQYKNARADYIKAIWNIINWNNVSERFRDCV